MILVVCQQFPLHTCGRVRGHEADRIIGSIQVLGAGQTGLDPDRDLNGGKLGAGFIASLRPCIGEFQPKIILLLEKKYIFSDFRMFSAR